jgi:periplasmic mercuric ion binding protein
MKLLILTIAFLVALSVNAQAQKSLKTVGIKTSAICQMCKATLEKDLTFEKGVKSVNLDLETKVLIIDFVEGKTNPDVLRKRVTMVGYHADQMKRDPKAYEKLDPCCKDGAHDNDPPVKKKGGI